MRTNGKDLIQQCIPDDWNVQDIFFMDVYNDWDIKAKLSHRTLINKDAKRKRGNRNAEMFQKLMFKNTSSFCNQFPIAYGAFKQAFEESCVGFAILTDRNNPSAKCKSSSYIKVEGLGDASNWKKALMQFILNDRHH